MDEKATRVVEEYSARVLGKLLELNKVDDILKNKDSSEADKIKAISKYFAVTGDDYSWSYHTFIEDLSKEI